MIIGAPWHDRPGLAGVFGMWVAPTARGTGAGDRLVQAIITWARESGYKSLTLDVADDNQAAIGLYDRCGFSPTGTLGSLPPPRDAITEHERSLVL